MSQPNIILITTDQMRADCLGIEGRQICETPFMDNMAQDGVRFTSSYCSVPSCIAARASIMTGQTQESHGRLGYRDKVPWTYEKTLPRSLRDAGYQTMVCGKMHVYPQRNAMGFEQMVLHEGNQNWNDGFVDDYHEFIHRETNGRVSKNDHGLMDNSWVARPWHTEERLHETNWTVTAALDMLRRRDPTRPFFLWLSFIKPHPPLDPPQPYWDMYIDEQMPPPAMGEWVDQDDAMLDTRDTNCRRGRLSAKNLQRMRAGYFGLITHIDAQISRFFKVLRRHLFVEPNDCFTLLTTDHGEMLGDHHYWAKSVGYEGAARLPFIIRAPKDWGGPRNTTVSNVIEHMDIFPTLCDAAGAPIPDTVEGTSLLPLARGETPATWREYIHGEHEGAHGMHYMTDGAEKYIWHWKTGVQQLFDLREDPKEERNLINAPEHAARTTLWRERMIAHLEPRGQDELTAGLKQ